jgi:capsular polysaccharide biosynthesis protein
VVVIAIVIGLLLPKTFEANSLIRIGKIKNLNIESVEDVKSVLFNEETLQEIVQKLGLPAKTNLQKITDMLRVKSGEKAELLLIGGQGNSPENALKLVNILSDKLVERHKTLFSEVQKTIDTEIETLQKNREKTEKDIEQAEKKIVRLDEDIKYYEGEIRIRSGVQSEGQGRIVESYINLLATIKNQKETVIAQIAEFKQNLVNIDLSLQQKEYEKTYETRPTTLDIPPILPQSKSGPSIRKIVLIGGFLGLIIGIVWALIPDYFSKTKRNYFNRIKR